jgi:hypothetical protein
MVSSSYRMQRCVHAFQGHLPLSMPSLKLIFPLSLARQGTHISIGNSITSPRQLRMSTLPSISFNGSTTRAPSRRSVFKRRQPEPQPVPARQDDHHLNSSLTRLTSDDEEEESYEPKDSSDRLKLSARGRFKLAPGTVYLVSTPIGNLDDISARSMVTLRDADVICAEDTRVTLKLLRLLFGAEVSLHASSPRCHRLMLMTSPCCRGRAIKPSSATTSIT